jgi:hypothetical protein
MSWLDRAACRGMDVNLFMPMETGGNNTVEVRQHNARAKAICSKCPTRAECRSLVRTAVGMREVPAIRTEHGKGAPRAEWLGVFGGETAYDRGKAIRAERLMQESAA